MALERGEWSAARPGRTLPRRKTRYPFYRRLGGPQGRSGRGGKSRSNRDSIPDRPARSQSLHRLSYPAHYVYIYIYIYIGLETSQYSALIKTSLVVGLSVTRGKHRTLERQEEFIGNNRKRPIACSVAYRPFTKNINLWLFRT